MPNKKNKKQNSRWKLKLGASPERDGAVSFCVWAPHCKHVDVKIVDGQKSPQVFPMTKDDQGYFWNRIPNISTGSRYLYILDHERERPDPASRFQPQSVHAASAIVDPKEFRWTDVKWKGLKLEESIFYEIHVGTFSESGTFDGVIEKLPHLKQLGVTCLEIMPVAQFPGWRNWGYDGVNLFAVQNSYGGPEGLKKLVNAAHRQGLAVCLDVVYNHFGPEGNYLREFGPYFSHKYQTPWGEAVNYDDISSHHVRDYIINNALYWVHEYHVDALRLDAVHAIYDFSAKHILEELNDRVQASAQKLGRAVHVIAESDLNDAKIIRSKKEKGFGLAAQWSDDFHHAFHVLATGEHFNYYDDFSKVEDFAQAWQSSFVYDWKYSRFRRRFHGSFAGDLPGERFVVCTQNHDQVGNRPFGDRLNQQLGFEAEKTAAVALLFSPYLPLIFMGQEYGEKAPFQYFIDHEDESLVKAVREGRQQEFDMRTSQPVPDPKSEQTFKKSKLDWELLKNPKHAYLLKLYRDLILLRKKYGILKKCNPQSLKVHFSEKHKWVCGISKSKRKETLVTLLSLSPNSCVVSIPGLKKNIQEILNTEDAVYGGELLRPQGTIYSRKITLAGWNAVIGKVL